MAVGPGAAADHDVDYLFAQVGIGTPVVDYRGNCGNLTAAVALYAVEEGLSADPATVRMHNRNTGTTIVAHLLGTADRPDPADLARAGQPVTGTVLRTEYLDPAGAVTGRALPTGRSRDVVRPRVGAPVEVSLVDVTAPVAFLDASDLGLGPHVTPADVNAAPDLLARLESIRGACAVLLGFAADEDAALAVSAALPRLALLTAGDGADLTVLATSMQRAHHACPLTTALCTAAATALPGTIPATLAPAVRPSPAPAVRPAPAPALRPAPAPAVRSAHQPATRPTHEPAVRLAHPRGVLTIGVTTEDGTIRSVSVDRTARRLLTGEAALPPGVESGAGSLSR
jgi:2-methylaconitate cis-trans-isomerase PrpF